MIGPTEETRRRCWWTKFYAHHQGLSGNGLDEVSYTFNSTYLQHNNVHASTLWIYADS